MNSPELNQRELAAWVGLVAVLELLPGVLNLQLRRDAGLTHFEYYALAMLSEAPRSTLPMTSLAVQTHATLARLSHVAQRLEARALVERFPSADDARVTNVRLTKTGWRKLRSAASGHVTTVRGYVIDALSPAQIVQLAGITDAILTKLDPDAGVAAVLRKTGDFAPRAPTSTTPRNTRAGSTGRSKPA